MPHRPRIYQTLINAFPIPESVNIGSWFLGGHTAEMMNVVTTVQKDMFTPRYYVDTLTDNMSLLKAQVYEQSLIQVEGNY
ncbi:hypothetical protein HU200_039094 [Digitaria exilis]|uniref:UDP-N-acetylglucosamine transferase subunit ALG14 n=1 Tax=Digitaria exilis TaxID=1010633 RepID=A0A835BNJ1_9POAL|nr:hypothetical protein HU200_039094 [Digitaria exilis]